ncbi:Uncharacterized protein Fot_29175 [Forsythia ovata]|uniref:Uncharacterized protein n=1 Tax=Forsythia ovata TaxID=205694 RepID=A0ABD1TR69_9LAMI
MKELIKLQNQSYRKLEFLKQMGWKMLGMKKDLQMADQMLECTTATIYLRCGGVSSYFSSSMVPSKSKLPKTRVPKSQELIDQMQIAVIEWIDVEDIDLRNIDVEDLGYGPWISDCCD